jgi:hypothetical protein
MIQPDQKRLAKLSAVCSLLSSNVEGECFNAAVIATRMIGDLGLDWRTVIERAFAEPAPIYAPPAPAPRQTWEAREFDPLCGLEISLALYEDLLEMGDAIKINQWERNFLEKLLAQKNTDLSAKQRTSLSWILRKYDAAVAKAERAAAKAREECHVA